MIALLHYLRVFLIYGIQIYRYVLLAYFLLSWLPGGYQSSLGQFLIRICEPFVGLFRPYIPNIGMVSLAGMIAFISLRFVEIGIDGIFRTLIQLIR